MKKRVCVLAAMILVFTTAACQEKGPLEKAGERADEVVDNAKKGEPLLHKKGPLEKAGESVDDSIKKTERND